ncbi:G patch domain-containing protein 1-like [Echeneis naucrates]|uniref:G patch domain-containing protein 1-like n=1 Tax=Echeneis naucrates TaxID=173247 RepID=UPI0011135095|nr:G patch domain-containing protein 1-like [Echeneis naucrates]
MASDSESEEDFVSFGTPLEPLEEDEPLKKPIPLHEQTVKDEKGRYKRFHGAFTGGFSAGYFNTVGSKEGWTPSTFLSSRQQKAEKQHARPEDFMDEEDFSEHGIAPSQITTRQEFSSSCRDETREKARAVNAQNALIPGDTLLEELIAPAKSSMGVELLKRMGWKEGQGLGPRVKRKSRHQQSGDGSGSRVYGCAPPIAGSEDSEDDDDEFAPQDVTFAPKDVTPVDFNPRVGVQGLGYRGLDPGLALLGQGAPEHIDLFKPLSETRTRLFGDAPRGSRRGGVAGQAFGVGALEDDDDEDVYHRDSMSRYDTVLGGEEPGDGLYGWTAPQQYKNRDRSRDVSYVGKILDGFTLAQKPAEEKTIFPPPTLPPDYRPVRRFRVFSLTGASPALAEALRVSRGHMVQDEPQPGGRHQLDSGQRRTLLGEDVLQGPSSVLDLLKPEDRKRLLNLRNSASQPPTTTESKDMQSHAESSSSGPSALSNTASFVLQQQQEDALASWRGVQTSLQIFKPFEKTPSKQARYELYLDRLRQGDKDALEQSLDSGMTEWERSREREEFVRASVLYRPSSSSLSSRFTRAKHQEDEDTVEVPQDQEGDVDDKKAAVKMKMFGKLTRETLEWHPEKLLCKRFNVPDPYPGSALVGLLKVKRDKFSVFNFLTVTETKAPPKSPEPVKKSRWDVSDQKEEKKKDEALSELLSAARHQTETRPDQMSAPAPPAPSSRDQTQTERNQRGQEEEEEEEESRPPMDLFKAIFASSSSSEGDSEEEEEDTKEEEVKPEPQEVNLFNISKVVIPAVTSSSTQNQPTDVVRSQTWTQEEFGPKLPPPSAAWGRGEATPLPREVDKLSRTSNDKKHKSKKQHKHKKDKKKKKHKKHKHKGKPQKKSKEESDSSSGDSDEDGHHGDGQTLADNLLKRLKTMRSAQTR